MALLPFFCGGLCVERVVENHIWVAEREGEMEKECKRSFSFLLFFIFEVS